MISVDLDHFFELDPDPYFILSPNLFSEIITRASNALQFFLNDYHHFEWIFSIDSK